MDQRRQRIEVFEEEIEAFVDNVREADTALRYRGAQVIEPLASCDPRRRTRERICSSTLSESTIYGEWRCRDSPSCFRAVLYRIKHQRRYRLRGIKGNLRQLAPLGPCLNAVRSCASLCFRPSSGSRRIVSASRVGELAMSTAPVDRVKITLDDRTIIVG